MNLSDFDYELPEELIAQRPLADRAASRLMVVDREGGRIAHRTFKDILDYLSPPECLVLNNTKVLPARLIGRKPTGGRVEIFLLREVRDGFWEALCRPAKRLPAGADVRFDGDVGATIVETLPEGRRLVKFSSPPESFRRRLADIGQAPLPPYIHHPLTDKERYQTVYAEAEGSVAAPTAGLHFTPELLAEIAGRGVTAVRITLDIGLDTFRPVKAERVEDHEMHSEKYSLPAEAASIINETKSQGGRVAAVGTTSVRVLETAAKESRVAAGGGHTKLFIYPGYQFKIVDHLLTNFHLPRSSLLMLVSAFAGRELIMAAYSEAIKEGYRFFSFGDAMLIL